MELTKLKNVLENIDSLEWDLALYIVRPSDYSLSTICSVLDPDETEELDGETFSFAKEHSLSYLISISEIQDIFGNASQQIANVSLVHFHKAFLHYIKNDAFIEYV